MPPEDRREWNLHLVLELEDHRRNRMHIATGGILLGFKNDKFFCRHRWGEEFSNRWKQYDERHRD